MFSHLQNPHNTAAPHPMQIMSHFFIYHRLLLSTHFLKHLESIFTTQEMQRQPTMPDLNQQESAQKKRTLAVKTVDLRKSANIVLRGKQNF